MTRISGGALDGPEHRLQRFGGNPARDDAVQLDPQGHASQSRHMRRVGGHRSVQLLRGAPHQRRIDPRFPRDLFQLGKGRTFDSGG